MVQTLPATWYLSAVALSISLWDYLLNLQKEIYFVWRQPWSFIQAILLFNRYSAGIGIVFIAVVVWWPSHQWQTCHALIFIITVFCVINSASSQFLMLLSVYQFWDNRKQIRSALIGGFLVCFAISLAFAGLSAHQLYDSLAHAPQRYPCALPPKVGFDIGMWAGMMLFNTYVFAIMIFNALNKPRRHDSEIVSNLLQDGALVFVVCFALRLIQLITSFSEGSILISVVAWIIDSIMSFRLFLKVKTVEVAARLQWQP
ncbi:hypothetical protein WOLCODRAFT_162420, partial [Wolfiporia cocos MD-104 SS10]